MGDLTPQDSESIGRYLKRLREGTGLTLQEVADRSKFFPKPQRITVTWLHTAESDQLDYPGGEKLRVLATLYSQLLKQVIPAAWLLDKAGYDISLETGEAVLASGPTGLTDLLRRPEVLALLNIARRLLRSSEGEADLEWLVRAGQRYADTRFPDDERILFDDPMLDSHVDIYLRKLGF